MIILFSCKKESKKGVPTISTTTVSSANIGTTTLTIAGVIPSDGGAVITERGVCWSPYPHPTTADHKTSDGIGSGGFTSTITGLTPGITYYVRTYATNIMGTVYGAELTLTTTTALSTIATTSASVITQTTVSSGGKITLDGGSVITARGICWSSSINPTITDRKTVDGTGTGIFSSNINKLISNNTYYVRAYATNSTGTSYGTQLSFKTLDNGLTEDINNYVPQSIIDQMIALGMPIYTGKTPPKIEGIYLISPTILVSSNVPNDVVGNKFMDMRVQFSNQDNTKLMLSVDWLEGTESGSSTSSWIIGSGNNFTVFVIVISRDPWGTQILMVQSFSGKVETTGIKDLFTTLFMIENHGIPSYISNGTGIL